jgi:hypothetical protein
VLRPFALAATIALILAAFACESGNDDTLAPVSPDSGDASADVDLYDGTAPPDVGYPAPHPALPQVQYMGGEVLSAPEIVAVTFASDPLAPFIADFVSRFAAHTSYWSGATGEYKVGPIRSAVTVTLSDPLPLVIEDKDIQAWLEAKFEASAGDAGGPDASSADAGTDAGAQPDAGPATLPLPDGQTIYAIFYPAAVTVVAGAVACTTYAGYHAGFNTKAGPPAIYAVMPRCPPSPGYGEIDTLAAVASHELVEAATDPLITISGDKPGWVGADPDHVAWEFLGGNGEVGDMCELFYDSWYGTATFPYLLQKVWSNSSALASHDPCQPLGSTPYFNSAPVLADDVAVSGGGSPVTTKGVTIPVGQSRDVEVDLFSDGPTGGPWIVRAIDVSSTVYGGDRLLSFAFDRDRGQNGERILMTVTVLEQGDAGPNGAELFWMESNLNGAVKYWPGFVGN